MLCASHFRFGRGHKNSFENPLKNSKAIRTRILEKVLEQTAFFVLACLSIDVLIKKNLQISIKFYFKKINRVCLIIFLVKFNFFCLSKIKSPVLMILMEMVNLLLLAGEEQWTWTNIPAQSIILALIKDIDGSWENLFLEAMAIWLSWRWNCQNAQLDLKIMNFAQLA